MSFPVSATMTVCRHENEFEVVVTALAWWNTEAGHNRTPSWEIEDIVARTRDDDDEIWLFPAEEEEAVSRLVRAAEAAAREARDP